MSASAAATVVNAAQKASTFANQTVETARFEAIKEPLGFIKVIQFLMAIFTFAIAVNGSSYVQFEIACDSISTTTPSTGTTPSPGYQILQAEFSYPYNLNEANFIPVQTCSKPKNLDRKTITAESNNIVSSSQFFVFTGVMAFLYSLAFLIIYVFFKHKYDNIIYFALIDFACTALFTLFWFAGSIAWAKAISDIKDYTNPGLIIESLKNNCPAIKNDCRAIYYPTYANIIISCILGFGNIILWGGDVWFVLKETSWYKTRKQLEQQQQNVTNNPIAGGTNVTASYNPNNKI